MKSLLDIPAIFRNSVLAPLPAWHRLNVTLGLSVWRPRRKY